MNAASCWAADGLSSIGHICLSRVEFCANCVFLKGQIDAHRQFAAADNAGIVDRHMQ